MLRKLNIYFVLLVLFYLAGDVSSQDAPANAAANGEKSINPVPEAPSKTIEQPAKTNETKGASENAPVTSVNITAGKGNKGEVRGKQAVITRLSELFKATPKPVRLTAKKYEPMAPYCKITQLSEGRSNLVYKFRFVTVEKVQDSVETLISSAGVVEVSPTQNMVVINDSSAMMEPLKAALIAIDVPQPQVIVETQVIEVYTDQGEERDIKVEYSNYDAKTNTTSKYGFQTDAATSDNRNLNQGGGFDSFPIANKDSNGNEQLFNAAIRWLNTSQDAKILSSPNLIADLGMAASMNTGEDLPIPETTISTSTSNLSVKYRRIGVKLKITPVLINKDTVQLEVSPEVSSVIRYTPFTQDTVTTNIPVISVRNITTRLTAYDGEVIMLGGLYSTETVDIMRKTPYISDIPVIGEWLSGKDSTVIDKQLLFFLKIHIVQQPESILLDPEAEARELREVGKSVQESKVLLPNRMPVPAGEAPHTQKDSSDRSPGDLKREAEKASDALEPPHDNEK